MKKIIIDRDKIKDYDQIDISLLKEGFIFNTCGLVINGIHGINHPFKIGLQFYPDKECVYVSVYGKRLEVITYYFAYNVMRGFQFARMDKDITQDEEEICAAYELITLAMNACMTLKDAAYDRAISYKKAPNDRDYDIKDLKACTKQKKRNKLSDVYLWDDLIIYMATTLPEEKLKRSFKCLVWDVRGFYRHYKSGKTVWINSFQKGKDRNKGKAADKTYIAGGRHDKPGSN